MRLDSTSRSFDEEQLQTIGSTAISHYDLGDTALEFLGHSDTIVYRVTQTDRDARYALRVHYPVTTIRSRWCERDAVESELDWMLAIRRDCSIPVQEPVVSRDGSIVASLLLPNGAHAHASLVRWVEGEEPTAFTREMAHQTGALVARLHKHGNRWRRPEGFARPRYDEQHLQEALGVLGEAVGAGLVSPQDYRIPEHTAERIIALMAEIGKGEGDWGLMHGDLNSENLICHNDCIVPIDFGSCGFGFYASDIAWALSYHIVPNDRQAFLEGYRTIRNLPTDLHASIGAFYLHTLTSALSWWASHPDHREWIRSALPSLVEKLFASYLRGETCLPLA